MGFVKLQGKKTLIYINPKKICAIQETATFVNQTQFYLAGYAQMVLLDLPISDVIKLLQDNSDFRIAQNIESRPDPEHPQLPSKPSVQELKL